MIGQSVKMAWTSVLSNKMRSFLTMLGIIIGVVALVVLVSIADGATSEVTDAISSIGTNLLTVTISDNKERPLTLAEFDDILKVPHVEAAAPTASGNMTVSYKRESENAQITGTGSDYLAIEGLALTAGRWLNRADMNNHLNVAVINQGLAEDLLEVRNSGDAVGMTISLNGTPFLVVGVLEESNSLSFFMTLYEVYIPYTSMMRLSDYVGNNISTFVISAGSDSEIDAMEKSIKTWMMERLDNDEDAFSIRNLSIIADAMDEAIRSMEIMLGGIAAISLLVGGIGIMNIMLVSVTERTREIGIRKAIGAGEGTIMLQFLIEALAVSLMGCILGVGLSWVLLKIITAVSGHSFPMDSRVVAAASVFSLLIGLLFGLYPARKAARKKPIDALHYAG